MKNGDSVNRQKVSLKWYWDGGDLCCKKGNFYVSVDWKVNPWGYRVVRMKKTNGKNGQWKSLADGPHFPYTPAAQEKAKKWAARWLISVTKET